MPRSLLIKGPFTEADLTQLMATIRSIERRSPSETFMMILLDDAMSVADAEATAMRIFPRIEGHEPILYVARATDVICPDGRSRQMRPDLPDNLVPDIDAPLRGMVEIGDKIVCGAAWPRHGRLYFEPD